VHTHKAKEIFKRPDTARHGV